MDFVFPFLPERLGLECGRSPLAVRAVPVVKLFDLRSERGALSNSSPDGSNAIVVAEALQRLDFRDPHTMALRFSLDVPRCPGVDHADISADGRTLLFDEEGGGGALAYSKSGGFSYAVYVRKTDGSPAVLLGEGENLFSGINLHHLGFTNVRTVPGENATHVFIKKG